MATSKHPRVESALTREDVSPGLSYVTYVPEQGEVIERGTFTSYADYDEGDNRWNASAVVIRGSQNAFERTVSLYDAGITPDCDGESWAQAVTVAADNE